MWVLHCNKCGKEIPKIKRKILNEEKEFYELGIVNEPFKNMFEDFNVHLCKECALKIENEILKAKVQLMEELKQ